MMPLKMDSRQFKYVHTFIYIVQSECSCLIVYHFFNIDKILRRRSRTLERILEGSCLLPHLAFRSCLPLVYFIYAFFYYSTCTLPPEFSVYFPWIHVFYL